MKFAKWLSVMTLAVLVGLVWKSDRGQGQNPTVKSTIIVSEIATHSPTAAGTELTLFTPAVSGLYRITAYAEVALANNAGGLCANVLWNDGSANPRDYPINFGPSGCASYTPSAARRRIRGSSGRALANAAGVDLASGVQRWQATRLLSENDDRSLRLL